MVHAVPISQDNLKGIKSDCFTCLANIIIPEMGENASFCAKINTFNFFRIYSIGFSEIIPDARH